jgi:hypothetical protein
MNHCCVLLHAIRTQCEARCTAFSTARAAVQHLRTEFRNIRTRCSNSVQRLSVAVQRRSKAVRRYWTSVQRAHVLYAARKFSYRRRGVARHVSARRLGGDGHHCGRICLKGRKVNLSQVFAGQQVGVRQVNERVWLVTFMHYDLGYFDDETCRLEPIENPFGPSVLPMSPE